MDFCKTERKGGILVVTMNNPDKLNALAPHSHEQMAKIFNDFDADPDLHVAILTGEGRAFCVGSDISAYVSKTNRPLPPEGGGGLTHNRKLSKPVIAAINGLCMGGGFEIALSCDIMLADETAEFALPEPKVGAAALGGGLVQLVNKLPPVLAMKLALTGDRLSAREALRLGLLCEVTAPGDVLQAALGVAEKMLACSPLSLRITREIMRRAIEGAPVDEIDALELTLREKSMQSADFAEGMSAFMEKRSPNWTGR